MKRLIGVVVVGLMAAAAWAGSPARIAGTVGTNGALTMAVAGSGSTAFAARQIGFGAAVGSTVTVHYVTLGVTNYVNTKLFITAADRLLSITNSSPWLFLGDSIVFAVTPSGTASTVVVSGEMNE